MALLSLKTLTQYIASAFPAAPQRTAMDFIAKRVASDVKTVTTSTYRVQPEDNTLILNRAGGIAVTLPAATGSGAKYKFVVATTFTSNATIATASSSDKFTGHAILAQDSADTVVHFGTAAGTDLLTMYTAANNTTGGIKGAIIEVQDIAVNLWSIFYISEAGGTEATPFDS